MVVHKSSIILTLKFLINWVQWLKPVILAPRETETERITVWGHFGQKAHKTLSQPMVGVVAHVFIPATWGSTNRRTVVQADWGIKWNLISKTMRKWLVEWFNGSAPANKGEALSSIPQYRHSKKQMFKNYHWLHSKVIYLKSLEMKPSQSVTLTYS
jgi:hypothetical protein